MVSDVFCHVGVIIKVGFIGNILRYVFEFNTCFSICFCVSILALHLHGMADLQARECSKR